MVLGNRLSSSLLHYPCNWVSFQAFQRISSIECCVSERKSRAFSLSWESLHGLQLLCDYSLLVDLALLQRMNTPEMENAFTACSYVLCILICLQRSVFIPSYSMGSHSKYSCLSLLLWFWASCLSGGFDWDWNAERPLFRSPFSFNAIHERDRLHQ
jgi:hypothetical protein